MRQKEIEYFYAHEDHFDSLYQFGFNKIKVLDITLNASTTYKNVDFPYCIEFMSGIKELYINTYRPHLVRIDLKKFPKMESLKYKIGRTN